MMPAKTLPVLTLLSLLSACANQPESPLLIQKQGSFAAGGTMTTAPGTFDPRKPLSPDGQTYHGDHAYAFYQIPVDARKLPIVMWHGAGQFSKTWETTADGREGFQNLFLRRHYGVYLIDQPRRGDAGRSSVETTIKPVPDEQLWFNQFRIGLWPNYFNGVQVARDAQSREQFFRAMTPNTGPFDMGVVSDGVSAVFDRIGPGILFTHSQGAADAAYQGASGGQPRSIDKPAYRIEDIHGMADFISQFAGVDDKRLGLLGICGGGGYSLAAAQTDKRFKSLATVSMFNSGRVRRNGYNDSQMDSIQQRLQQASSARAQEAAGGAVLYSGDANLTDEQIAKLPFELYRQGYEYYWKTHAHPNSTFKYTTSSLIDLMRFDATHQIELINQPLLMIAGSKADSLYMTQDAFPKATGTTDKEVFILEGATHIETYWVPRYVDAAISKLSAFYARTL